MGKVTSFSLNGYQLRFYSNDHRPPHFHATKGQDWEIRIFIETTTRNHLHYKIKWSNLNTRQPARQSLKTLAKLVSEYRLELLEEWEIKVAKIGSSQG